MMPWEIEDTALVKFKTMVAQGAGNTLSTINWRCPASNLDALLRVLRLNGEREFSVAVTEWDPPPLALATSDAHRGHTAHSISEPCIPQCSLYRCTCETDEHYHGRDGTLRCSLCDKPVEGKP